MHKRILGSLSRKDSGNSVQSVNGDSPEATAARGVRLFCESGGPQNTGDEVLHLPTIVEAAESGPAAASQAALEIRRFLSTKNYARAYVQYNAIMLTRILADNPGKSFTRNMDAKFVNTVKELLREGRDVSVQQILRETLEAFEKNKPNDETLTLLREMWQKEKTKVNNKRGSQIQSPYGSPMVNPHLQQQQQQQQNYFARQHKSKTLPSPSELSQRVEEAKTSAKLLTQLTQSTPPGEVLNNELLKEFADRCASASRSMQNYIHSDSPAPDEDTLLTLIETNDALAGAMSRHQRAVLTARKVTGVSPAPQQATNDGGGGGIFNGPPPPQQYQQPPSQPYQPTPQPFSQPAAAEPQAEQPRSNAHSLFTRASDKFRLSQQKPKTQASSTSQAPFASQAPTTGPNVHEAPTPPLASHPKNQPTQPGPTSNDPFADANEAPQPSGMQAPLVPLNYGLPPDSMPVPGSPKGGTANAPWDSSVETQSAVFGGSAAGRTENARGLDGGGPGASSGWAGSAIQSQGAVQPRGEAPILQAPKPKYRF